MIVLTKMRELLVVRLFFGSGDPHVAESGEDDVELTGTGCFPLGGVLKFTEGNNSWEVEGNQFCKADDYDTAISGTIQYSTTDYSADKTIDTDGTIASCSCSDRVSATIFTIGFSLLAILASLWK